MYTQNASQAPTQPNHLNPPAIAIPMQNHLTQACCSDDNNTNVFPWGVAPPNFDYATLPGFSSHPPAVNTMSTETMLGSLPSPTGLSTSTYATEESWDTTSVGDVENDLEQTPEFESAIHVRRPSHGVIQKQHTFTEFHDFRAEEHLPKNKKKVPKSSEYVFPA
jgi:hypothetical protein